jgi:hypothetical protein
MIDSFTALLNRMYKKCGKWDGGFVAKPRDQLPTNPLAPLGRKFFTGKTLKVIKYSEGAFGLVFQEPFKRNRRENFVKQSHIYDETLSKGVDLTVPFWMLTLDLFEEFFQIKKECSKYVVDLEATLFQLKNDK